MLGMQTWIKAPCSYHRLVSYISYIVCKKAADQVIKNHKNEEQKKKSLSKPLKFPGNCQRIEEKFNSLHNNEPGSSEKSESVASCIAKPFVDLSE